MQTKQIVGARCWMAGSNTLATYEGYSYNSARQHRVIFKNKTHDVATGHIELADAGRDWLPELCDVEENWLTKVSEAKMSRDGSDWFYDG